MSGMEDEKALYAWVFKNNARNMEMIRNSLSTGPENRQHLLNFVASCEAKGLSQSRISFYLQRLITMAKFFQKDFKILTRPEVDTFMTTVARDSPWTRDNYVVTFQNLYRYLFDLASTDRLPDCVRGLKRTRGSNHLVPERLFTQEDVEKVIEAVPKISHIDPVMWQSLISTLYSTAVRPAECRSIKIGNCFPDPSDLSVRIRIDMGKTSKMKGERDVFIYIKRDYDNFMAWYNNHPRRDDANAWLFFQEVNHYQRDEKGRVVRDSSGNDILLTHSIEPLTYPTLCNNLNRLGKEAGITKKMVTGYGYRHARAHHLYKSTVNHMVVAKMMGHSLEIGEKTYASLSSKTVANEMRRFEGQNINSSPSIPQSPFAPSQSITPNPNSNNSPSQTLTVLRQSEQNPPSSSSPSPPVNSPSQTPPQQQSTNSPTNPVNIPSQLPQNQVSNVNDFNNSTNFIDTQAPNTNFHEGNSMNAVQLSDPSHQPHENLQQPHSQTPLQSPTQLHVNGVSIPSQLPQNEGVVVNPVNVSIQHIDTPFQTPTFHEGNSINEPQFQQIHCNDSQSLHQLPPQHINYAQNNMNYTRDITLQELQLRQYREQLNANATMTQQHSQQPMQQHCQCAYCQQQLMLQSQQHIQPVQYPQPVASVQQPQQVQSIPPQRPNQPVFQPNQFADQATPLPGVKKYPRSHLVEAVMGQIKMGLVNPDDVRRALDNLGE